MNTPIEDLFCLAKEALLPVVWTEKKALQKFKESATPEHVLEVEKTFRALERDNQMILAGADWMDFMAETTRKALERAEAAEAKLAELEKQGSVAWQCNAHGLMQTEDKKTGRPMG